MKQVNLTRISENAIQTLRTLSVGKDNDQVFTCKTLELAWKNHQKRISCFPKGSYLCKYTRSNRISAKVGLDVFTYEVLNVPNRAGIRIHSANFFLDLLGCFSPYRPYQELNSDGELETNLLKGEATRVKGGDSSTSAPTVKAQFAPVVAPGGTQEPVKTLHAESAVVDADAEGAVG